MCAAVSFRALQGYGFIVAAAVCWSLIGVVGRLPPDGAGNLHFP